MKREAPHFDLRNVGGTKALRNLSAMFLEMHRYTKPRRRSHGWPRAVTTAELAQRTRL